MTTIDSGRKPGLTTDEHKELVELRRAAAGAGDGERDPQARQRLLRPGERAPKIGFRLVQELAADGVPVAVACRFLNVSTSGYYDWRGRSPSPRAVADAELTTTIRRHPRRLAAAPTAHRGCYAELRLGLGVRVGRKRVARLMRLDGLVGVSPPPQAARLEAGHRDARGPREAHSSVADCAEPALVLRHHAAPRPGRMGLLRRRDRRLLPPDRGLVDLGPDHRGDRRRRARDGPLATPTRTRNRRSRGPRQRNTPAGSSGTGSAKPACSDRWAESHPASTTRSSSRFWSTMQRELLDRTHLGLPRAARARPCSSGSRASTTPAAGTPASATSAPPTTKPFTPPPKSRHDQHTRTVRETGSGSSLLGQS